MSKNEKKKEKVKKPVEEPEKKAGKKKGKAGKVIAIVAGILVVLGAGGYFLKGYLTRTVAETETVAVAEDMKEFSGFYKEYVLNRLKITELGSYTFRTLSKEEILSQLSALKDGFSRISRGMNDVHEGSEYKEMAEILKNDATVFLKEIRELRAVMTEEFGNEADRQAKFMTIVSENENMLRSGIYLSPSAFEEGRGGLASEGVMIFRGEGITEVGGGVMNIFVGDVEKGAVAVVASDFSETVRTIRAEKLFGWTGGSLVKIGTGVKAEIEVGKLNEIKAEVKGGEATVARRKVDLRFKTTWDLTEELGSEAGVVGEKKSSEKLISEVVEAIEKGK